MPFILLQSLAAAFLTLNLTIGYGVAPVLFSHLSAQVAGTIMAVLLSATYWVDGVVLLIMLVLIRKGFCLKRESLLMISLGAVGLNLAWISPIMAEIKQLTVDAPMVMGMGFAAWHGISQMLFLIAWVSVLAWMSLSYMRYVRKK